MNIESFFTAKIKWIILLGAIMLPFIGVLAQSDSPISIEDLNTVKTACFGTPLGDISISIEEGDSADLQTSSTNEGYKVVITAPLGYHFTKGPTLKASSEQGNGSDVADLENTAKIGEDGKIVFTFSVGNTLLKDKISITGIELTPKHGVGEDKEDGILVQLYSYKSSSDTKIKDENLISYTMEFPMVTLSVEKDATNNIATAFCEYDENIGFNAGLVESSGCSGDDKYDSLQLIGIKYKNNEPEYTILESYVGAYTRAAINSLDIKTEKLTTGYAEVMLKVWKGEGCFVTSEPLTIGKKEDNVIDDIELLVPARSFSFKNYEESIGVNNGKILMYSFLDDLITDEQFSSIYSRAEKLYLDEKDDAYLVYPRNAYPYISGYEPIFRFEFPNDIDGDYQTKLNTYSSFYYDYCSNNYYYSICDYFARNTFSNTAHFDPLDDFVDYSNPNPLVYHELKYDNNYKKYCSLYDTVYIKVIPEDINIPSDLCASDDTEYKIRVDTGVGGKGFPVGAIFDSFKITIPNVDVDTAFYSVVGGDDQAKYYGFNPSTFFSAYDTTGKENLVVVLTSYVKYGYDNTTYTTRLYEKVVTIHNTNYEDKNIEGIAPGAAYCYDPLDSLRVTSNYTINSLTGTSVSSAFSGATIDWYVKPSRSYDTSGIWPNQMADSVILFFNDLNGCAGYDTIRYTIKPAPKVDFDVSELCVGDTAKFNTEQSLAGVDDTLKSYIWSFGDGSVYNSETTQEDSVPKSFDNGVTSGKNNAPRHKYSFSGNYKVTLQMKTKEGCKNSITDTVRIEDIPEPDFEFSHTGKEQNTLEFINTSVPSEFLTTSYTYYWDFGDTQVDSTINLEDTITNDYAQHGIYEVVLMPVTDSNKCANSIIRKVPVFPYVKVTDDSIAKYTFTEGDGWYASKEFDGGGPSGWHLGPVFSAWKDKHHDDEGLFWYTGIPDDKVNNEASWLESPCFDIRELNLPTLSVDLFLSLESGRDGAVVQYTLDDGNTWQRLGVKGEGANWYNREGIYSEPGINNAEHDFNTDYHGWSTDTTAWITARYQLDDLRDTLRDSSSDVCVRFRIAYNSNDYHDLFYEGLGVDNFVVGQRKRIVLLEQCINSTYDRRFPDGYVYDPEELNNFVDSHPEEVVDIRCHTTTNTMNDELFNVFGNMNDNDSRATLYHGRDCGSLWAMDGQGVINKSEFGCEEKDISYQQGFAQRGLVAPAFKIYDVMTENDGRALKVTATVKKISSHIDEKLGEHEHNVRMAIVQKEFTHKGKDYRNVLVELLPTGDGEIVEKLTDFTVGDVQTVSESWVPQTKTEGNKFRLVIFVQGRSNYHEVEQVWFRDLDLAEVPQTASETGFSGLESISQEEIEVYPNPARGVLNVRMLSGSLSNATWSVYSISGQEIIGGKTMFEGEGASLDVSSLQNGLYILRLKDKNDWQYSCKFSILKN